MSGLLGEAGIKALTAERLARKAAEAQVRELRAALLDAAGDANRLADRLATAMERLTQ